MCVNSATSFLGIGFATLLRYMLLELNRKLDRESVSGAGSAGDLTTGKALTQAESERREEAGLPGEGAVKGFRFIV